MPDVPEIAHSEIAKALLRRASYFPIGDFSSKGVYIKTQDVKAAGLTNVEDIRAFPGFCEFHGFNHRVLKSDQVVNDKVMADRVDSVVFQKERLEQIAGMTLNQAFASDPDRKGRGKC
jgi:hypothetical protein